MDVIFTIVSRNYAALAASLMESVAVHEPAARRVVVATDGPMPQLEDRAEVLDAATLEAPFRDMCVYYDALELNTAVKPYVFLKLLAEPGVDSVTYLDPDIRLFTPLHQVREGLAEAELVLTPHLTRPLLGEANPNDQAIMKSGVYNLGFAAVRGTPKGRALLQWWADRCRFDCRVDLPNGLFTDQRWMDLSPGFVDRLHLIRDPGYNLAYWNLEGRTLARAGDGWTVDGKPLAFFHFSGFDATRPKTLSKHQNRLSVTTGSPLAELLADYGKVLLGNGQATSSAIPYAHGKLDDGRPFTGAMRRRALRAARGGETFPAGLGEATSAWFDQAEPEAVVPGLPDITRLMDQVWRDTAAADHFDRATTEGRAGFHRWFADNAKAVGADARAVAAAQAMSQGRGGARQADPEAWRDIPWRGPAAEVATWLREPHAPPRACLALLASRADLRQRFAKDPDGLLAWCLGPEAAAGRFALDLLPAPVLADLARDTAPLFTAARFADSASASKDLRRRLGPGFGVGERARWPASLTGPLRAPYLVPAEGLPRPYVKLFRDIWEDRSDVQRIYPLTTLISRLKYLRWLLVGGFKEYGVEPTALPARVRNHPLLRLAILSVRHRLPAAPTKPIGRADVLLVVETFDQAPRVTAGAAIYEAASGRFRGPALSQANLVVFLTDPGHVPADAIALHAGGLSWNRAAGLWGAATIAGLTDQNLILGFIDEVIAREGAGRDDLFRPVVTLAASRLSKVLWA
ncbi:MAG: hypothetical protein ABW360_15205 [Phenylobacterium sp.]